MGLPVAALLPGGQPVVLRAATRSDVCALVELFADDELGAARDGRQLARADRSSAGRRRPARTGSGPADPEAADLRRRSTAASAQPTNTHNAAAARRANDFAAAAAAAGAHVLYTRQILDRLTG